MKITLPTLNVTVNEFPDYVTNCPCTFTKEYMMKKIRKKRKALIKEILDSFEEDRLTREPIEFIDTDNVVISYTSNLCNDKKGRNNYGIYG